MKTFVMTILSFLFLTNVAMADSNLEIPKDSSQLVLVVSDHWNDRVAKMWRFERASAEEPWEKVGSSVTVNLGRTGLAWGESALMKGDLGSKGDLHKREGDGRSPAGIFPLLKAFGHPSKPRGYRKKNLPFLLLSGEQCVDDKNSPYYNQVVDPDEVGGVTWMSAEKMKIGVYELGLVVGHNCPKAKPGYGSCIFFHLEGEPGRATAGCTSMDGKPLTELVLWLEHEKQPVVVQLPKKEYQRRAAGLPKISR